MDQQWFDQDDDQGQFAVDLGRWKPELHPRDSEGKFRNSWGLSPKAMSDVERLLAGFNPPALRSDQHAASYLRGQKGSRTPKQKEVLKYFLTREGNENIQGTLRAADEDTPAIAELRRMAKPLKHDIIVSRVVGPDAFGLAPGDIRGVEEWTGKLVNDKGFSPTNIGNAYPIAGPHVEMRILVPRGTPAIVVGDDGDEANARTVILAPDQNLRLGKIQSDGRGGWYVMATVAPNQGAESPRGLGRALPASEKSPAIEATPDELERRGISPEEAGIPAPQEQPDRFGPATPAPGAGQQTAPQAQTVQSIPNPAAAGPVAQGGPPGDVPAPAKAIKQAGGRAPVGGGQVVDEGTDVTPPEKIRPRKSIQAVPEEQARAADAQQREAAAAQKATAREARRVAAERVQVERERNRLAKQQEQITAQQQQINELQAKQINELQAKQIELIDRLLPAQGAQPTGEGSEGGTSITGLSEGQKDNVLRRLRPQGTTDEDRRQQGLAKAIRAERGLPEDGSGDNVKPAKKTARATTPAAAKKAASPASAATDEADLTPEQRNELRDIADTDELRAEYRQQREAGQTHTRALLSTQEAKSRGILQAAKKAPVAKKAPTRPNYIGEQIRGGQFQDLRPGDVVEIPPRNGRPARQATVDFIDDGGAVHFTDNTTITPEGGAVRVVSQGKLRPSKAAQAKAKRAADRAAAGLGTNEAIRAGRSGKITPEQGAKNLDSKVADLRRLQVQLGDQAPPELPQVIDGLEKEARRLRGEQAPTPEAAKKTAAAVKRAAKKIAAERKEDGSESPLQAQRPAKVAKATRSIKKATPAAGPDLVDANRPDAANVNEIRQAKTLADINAVAAKHGIRIPSTVGRREDRRAFVEKALSMQDGESKPDYNARIADLGKPPTGPVRGRPRKVVAPAAVAEAPPAPAKRTTRLAKKAAPAPEAAPAKRIAKVAPAKAPAKAIKKAAPAKAAKKVAPERPVITRKAAKKAPTKVATVDKANPAESPVEPKPEPVKVAPTAKELADKKPPLTPRFTARTGAKEYRPSKLVKTARLVDKKPDGSPLGPDDESFIDAEWGERQKFIGPYMEIVGADGKVGYGSDLGEWNQNNERVRGAKDGWVKITPVTAYRHTGPPRRVETILKKDGKLHKETPNVAEEGDWIVRQSGGEVQVVSDAEFRKRYQARAPQSVGTHAVRLRVQAQDARAKEVAARKAAAAAKKAAPAKAAKPVPAKVPAKKAAKVAAKAAPKRPVITRKATAKKVAGPAPFDRDTVLARLEKSGRSRNPMSREEAAQLLEGASRSDLGEMAKTLNIPRWRTIKAADLKREVVDATVGRRLDSIATRGFRGDRPSIRSGLRPEDAGSNIQVSELARGDQDLLSDPNVADLQRRLDAGTTPQGAARLLRRRAGVLELEDPNATDRVRGLRLLADELDTAGGEQRFVGTRHVSVGDVQRGDVIVTDEGRFRVNRIEKTRTGRIVFHDADGNQMSPGPQGVDIDGTTTRKPLPPEERSVRRVKTPVEDAKAPAIKKATKKVAKAVPAKKIAAKAAPIKKVAAKKATPAAQQSLSEYSKDLQEKMGPRLQAQVFGPRSGLDESSVQTYLKARRGGDTHTTALRRAHVEQSRIDNLRATERKKIDQTYVAKQDLKTRRRVGAFRDAHKDELGVRDSAQLSKLDANGDEVYWTRREAGAEHGEAIAGLPPAKIARPKKVPAKAPTKAIKKAAPEKPTITRRPAVSAMADDDVMAEAAKIEGTPSTPRERAIARKAGTISARRDREAKKTAAPAKVAKTAPAAKKAPAKAPAKAVKKAAPATFRPMSIPAGPRGGKYEDTGSPVPEDKRDGLHVTNSRYGDGFYVDDKDGHHIEVAFKTEAGAKRRVADLKNGANVHRYVAPERTEREKARDAKEAARQNALARALGRPTGPEPKPEKAAPERPVKVTRAAEKKTAAAKATKAFRAPPEKAAEPAAPEAPAKKPAGMIRSPRPGRQEGAVPPASEMTSQQRKSLLAKVRRAGSQADAEAVLKDEVNADVMREIAADNGIETAQKSIPALRQELAKKMRAVPDFKPLKRGGPAVEDATPAKKAPRVIAPQTPAADAATRAILNRLSPEARKDVLDSMTPEQRQAVQDAVDRVDKRLAARKAAQAAKAAVPEAPTPAKAAKKVAKAPAKKAPSAKAAKKVAAKAVPERPVIKRAAKKVAAAPEAPAAAPAKKAVRPLIKRQGKAVTSAEARKESALEAVRSHDMGNDAGIMGEYRAIERNLQSGDLTPAQAKGQARREAQKWRRDAKTLRANKEIPDRDRQQSNARMLEAGERYDKLADAIEASQTRDRIDAKRFGEAPAAAPAKRVSKKAAAEAAPAKKVAKKTEPATAREVRAERRRKETPAKLSPQAQKSLDRANTAGARREAEAKADLAENRKYTNGLLKEAGVKRSDLSDLDQTGLEVVGGQLRAGKISKAAAARRLRTDRDSKLNDIADSLVPAKKAASVKKSIKAAPAAKVAKVAPAAKVAKKAAPEKVAKAAPVKRATKAVAWKASPGTGLGADTTNYDSDLGRIVKFPPIDPGEKTSYRAYKKDLGGKKSFPTLKAAKDWMEGRDTTTKGEFEPGQPGYVAPRGIRPTVTRKAAAKKVAPAAPEKPVITRRAEKKVAAKAAKAAVPEAPAKKVTAKKAPAKSVKKVVDRNALTPDQIAERDALTPEQRQKYDASIARGIGHDTAIRGVPRDDQLEALRRTTIPAGEEGTRAPGAGGIEALRQPSAQFQRPQTVGDKRYTEDEKNAIIKEVHDARAADPNWPVTAEDRDLELEAEGIEIGRAATNKAAAAPARSRVTGEEIKPKKVAPAVVKTRAERARRYDQAVPDIPGPEGKVLRDAKDDLERGETATSVKQRLTRKAETYRDLARIQRETGNEEVLPGEAARLDRLAEHYEKAADLAGKRIPTTKKQIARGAKVPVKDLTDGDVAVLRGQRGIFRNPTPRKTFIEFPDGSQEPVKKTALAQMVRDKDLELLGGEHRPETVEGAPVKKVAKKAAKAARPTIKRAAKKAAPEGEAAPAKKARPTIKRAAKKAEPEEKFLTPLANGTRRKTATNLKPGDKVRFNQKGSEPKEVASVEREGHQRRVSFTDGTSTLNNSNTVYWMVDDVPAERSSRRLRGPIGEDGNVDTSLESRRARRPVKATTPGDESRVVPFKRPAKKAAAPEAEAPAATKVAKKATSAKPEWTSEQRNDRFELAERRGLRPSEANDYADSEHKTLASWRKANPEAAAPERPVKVTRAAEKRAAAKATKAAPPEAPAVKKATRAVKKAAVEAAPSRPVKKTAAKRAIPEKLPTSAAALARLGREHGILGADELSADELRRALEMKRADPNVMPISSSLIPKEIRDASPEKLRAIGKAGGFELEGDTADELRLDLIRKAITREAVKRTGVPETPAAKKAPTRAIKKVAPETAPEKETITRAARKLTPGQQDAKDLVKQHSDSLRRESSSDDGWVSEADINASPATLRTLARRGDLEVQEVPGPRANSVRREYRPVGTPSPSRDTVPSEPSPAKKATRVAKKAPVKKAAKRISDDRLGSSWSRNVVKDANRDLDNGDSDSEVADRLRSRAQELRYEGLSDADFPDRLTRDDEDRREVAVMEARRLERLADDLDAPEPEPTKKATRAVKKAAPEKKAAKATSERPTITRKATKTAPTVEAPSREGRVRDNGMIPLGKLEKGDRIMVRPGYGKNDDKWIPSSNITGKAITVDSIEETARERGFQRTTNRRAVIGHDDEGNVIRIEGFDGRGYPGHQTFRMEREGGSARKSAAKKAAPEAPAAKKAAPAKKVAKATPTKAPAKKAATVKATPATPAKTLAKKAAVPAKPTPRRTRFTPSQVKLLRRIQAEGHLDSDAELTVDEKRDRNRLRMHGMLRMASVKRGDKRVMRDSVTGDGRAELAKIDAPEKPAKKTVTARRLTPEKAALAKKAAPEAPAKKKAAAPAKKAAAPAKKTTPATPATTARDRLAGRQKEARIREAQGSVDLADSLLRAADAFRRGDNPDGFRAAARQDIDGATPGDLTNKRDTHAAGWEALKKAMGPERNWNTPDKLEARLRKVLGDRGISVDHKHGDRVKFDPDTMEGFDGTSFNPGDDVTVIRPALSYRDKDGSLHILRPATVTRGRGGDTDTGPLSLGPRGGPFGDVDLPKLGEGLGDGGVQLLRDLRGPLGTPGPENEVFRGPRGLDRADTTMRGMKTVELKSMAKHLGVRLVPGQKQDSIRHDVMRDLRRRLGAPEPRDQKERERLELLSVRELIEGAPEGTRFPSAASKQDLVEIRLGDGPVGDFHAGTMQPRAQAVKDAFDSGTTDRKYFSGGSMGQVAHVDTGNGKQLIRKRMADDWFRPAKQSIDAEQLISELGERVDAPQAAGYRPGEKVFYGEYIPGPMAFSHGDEAIAAAVATPKGRRIAILDAITANSDRHNNNFKIVDGEPVGFDNSLVFDRDSRGLAFGPDGEILPGGVHSEDPFEQHYQYRTKFLDTTSFPGITLVKGGEWLDQHPFPQEELLDFRRELEAMKPQFERLDRQDWWDQASQRLDALIKRARPASELGIKLEPGAREVAPEITPAKVPAPVKAGGRPKISRNHGFVKFDDNGNLTGSTSNGDGTVARLDQIIDPNDPDFPEDGIPVRDLRTHGYDVKKGRLTRHDGVLYLTEEGDGPNDKERRERTLKEAQKWHGDLSEKEKKYVKSISSLSGANPSDPYWRQHRGLEKFESAASAGNGEINIFKHGGDYGSGSSQSILDHELGHLVDQEGSTRHRVGSRSERWEQAGRSDNVGLRDRAPGFNGFNRLGTEDDDTGGKNTYRYGVSRYGTSDPGEDFAEAYEAYKRGWVGSIDDPDNPGRRRKVHFRELYPARAAVFDELFPERKEGQQRDIAKYMAQDPEVRELVDFPQDYQAWSHLRKMDMSQMRALAKKVGDGKSKYGNTREGLFRHIMEGTRGPQRRLKSPVRQSLEKMDRGQASEKLKTYSTDLMRELVHELDIKSPGRRRSRDEMITAILDKMHPAPGERSSIRATERTRVPDVPARAQRGPDVSDVTPTVLTGRQGLDTSDMGPAGDTGAGGIPVKDFTLRSGYNIQHGTFFRQDRIPYLIEHEDTPEGKAQAERIKDALRTHRQSLPLSKRRLQRSYTWVGGANPKDEAMARHLGVDPEEWMSEASSDSLGGVTVYNRDKFGFDGVDQTLDHEFAHSLDHIGKEMGGIGSESPQWRAAAKSDSAHRQSLSDVTFDQGPGEGSRIRLKDVKPNPGIYKALHGVTDYGSTDDAEDFAESFRLYRAGIIGKGRRAPGGPIEPLWFRDVFPARAAILDEAVPDFAEKQAREIARARGTDLSVAKRRELIKRLIRERDDSDRSRAFRDLAKAPRERSSARMQLSPEDQAFIDRHVAADTTATTSKVSGSVPAGTSVASLFVGDLGPDGVEIGGDGVTLERHGYHISRGRAFRDGNTTYVIEGTDRLRIRQQLEALRAESKLLPKELSEHTRTYVVADGHSPAALERLRQANLGDQFLPFASAGEGQGEILFWGRGKRGLLGEDGQFQPTLRHEASHNADTALGNPSISSQWDSAAQRGSSGSKVRAFGQRPVPGQSSLRPSGSGEKKGRFPAGVTAYATASAREDWAESAEFYFGTAEHGGVIGTGKIGNDGDRVPIWFRDLFPARAAVLDKHFPEFAAQQRKEIARLRGTSASRRSPRMETLPEGTPWKLERPARVRPTEPQLQTRPRELVDVTGDQLPTLEVPEGEELVLRNLRLTDGIGGPKYTVKEAYAIRRGDMIYVIDAEALAVAESWRKGAIDAIEELHADIPPEMLQHQRGYVIIGGTNPSDYYFQATYDSSFATLGSAGGGDGMTYLWRRTFKPPLHTRQDKQIEHTVKHENAHNVDSTLGWPSKTPEWADAARKDNVHRGRILDFKPRAQDKDQFVVRFQSENLPRTKYDEPFEDGVTNYGLSSAPEDFAEALAMYEYGPLGTARFSPGGPEELVWFRDIFPERAAFLDQRFPQFAQDQLRDIRRRRPDRPVPFS